MPLDLTDELRQLLRGNFLLASLSDEEIDHVATRATLVHCPPDTVIVREGEEAESMFVVLAGGVNVLKGTGQFLAFLGPGGFFGEMGLFMPGTTRSATCVSVVQTRCLVLDRLLLDAFCNEHAEMGLKVYKAIISALAERLQATSADLVTLMEAHVKSQKEVSAIVARAKAKRTKARKDEGAS